MKKNRLIPKIAGETREDHIPLMFDESMELLLDYIETHEEIEKISRCNFFTSIDNKQPIMQTKGMKGGRVYLPYAFTEQGVYMLMTILHGDLATKQSRALIMLFKSMKDYIFQGQTILAHQDNLKIIDQIIKHAEDITEVKHKISQLDNKIKTISNKMGEVVTESEISSIILNFTNHPAHKEFLFLNGEPAKASETYQEIYSQAQYSIYLIDDYINLKTLRHLHFTKPNIKITVFSDNLGHHLHQSDYLDVQNEYPHLKINFIKTNRIIHDRFIILDYGSKKERVFHCGASSKDAGNKITVISELTSNLIHSTIKQVINLLLTNPPLNLK